ncbi:hypothetical protein D9M72_479890 [compost metagenome]
MVIRVDAVGLEEFRTVGLTHVTRVLLNQPAFVSAVLELDPLTGCREVGAYVTRLRVGLTASGFRDACDEPGLAPGAAFVGGLHHGRGNDIPVGVVVAVGAGREAGIL